MAKYLDYNGVKYLWQKALGRFSKKGHTHSVTLSGGSAQTVVTGITANTPTSLSVTNNILTVSAGTAASASTASITVPTSGTSGADIDPD